MTGQQEMPAQPAEAAPAEAAPAGAPAADAATGLAAPAGAATAVAGQPPFSGQAPGVYLQDVFGVVAVAQPAAFTTRPIAVDVETRGELTRGMSVVDARLGARPKPNVELAVDVNMDTVRQYMNHILEQAV